MLALLLLACGPKAAPEAPAEAPVALIDPGAPAPRTDQVDELHGITILDPYRTLEDEAVAEPWITAEQARYQAYTESLPQRQALYDRFQELWRYDDATVRTPCLIGEREVWRTKQADQDKWVWHLAMSAGEPGKVVVDPNEWGESDQLASFTPSPDCRYAVVGRAEGGNETPVLSVLDLDSLETLPDSVAGWKQRGVSWKHDNSGFFYMSLPMAGTVPEGDEFYWVKARYHALGTGPDQDEVVLSSEEDKNLYNHVGMSEDGRWQIRSQGLFNRQRAWLVDTQARRQRQRAPRPIVDDLEGKVRVTVVGDKVLIHTDIDTPRWHVMVADVSKPGKAHWKELIPEREDKLMALVAAGDRLFATYSHNVTSQIVMFDLEGNELGQVELPTAGRASVWGRWGLDDVRIRFESFAHPRTEYRYDLESGELSVLREPAIPVDQAVLDRIVTDQVWFTSRDGTPVPMFVVHDIDADRGGPIPVLMTGYGGFDISKRPGFSTTALTWIERGGAYVVPNLRGGGEFGKEWHEAGMRERKQNVFDDFIGAAKWLIAEGWTTPEQLAISGGSNGGLLVAAAITQAPELFGAVQCSVPLTDMVRFHHFGIADIWTEEYGSPDDPEMLPHLLKYSPYHAVRKGTDYPALLVVGSANDARTHPIHATKFAAHIKHADADGGTEEPIMLDVRTDSGHHGGVGTDVRADQRARSLAFLMHAVGL